jgi:ABC-2 type transport system permease protein
MTASIATVPGRSAGQSIVGRLAGARPLLRKDTGEWLHARRGWVILAVSAVFMVLAAANGAIATWVLANVPDGSAGSAKATMDPMTNFLAAVTSQIFIVAAIFGSMGLLVSERDHGTLAWVASKPVARGSIWMSKWIAGSAAIAIVGGVVPLLATVGLVVVVYGAIPAGVVVMSAVGIVAAIAFFVAVVLAASTVVSNQAAVAAIGFAVFALPTIIVGLLPVDISPWLPTSITAWAIGLGAGMDVGMITPIAWAIATIGIVALAIWRMEATEL